MKTPREVSMKRKNDMKVFILFLTVSIMQISGTLSFAAGPWTSIASTGIMTHSSLSNALITDNKVEMNSAAPSGSSIVLKYDLQSLATISAPDASNTVNTLGVSFKDNGSGAQVLVYIKRLDLNSGSLTTIATFDSNSYPSSDGWQKRTKSISTIAFGFDGYAYYIEAQLKKNASGGTPGLFYLLLFSAP